MPESPIKDTNIPQLSYDIIARVLPGFFVLAMIVFSSTVFVEIEEAAGNNIIHSIRLRLLGMAKVEVGFFDTIAFLVVSYLLGWIFYRSSTEERKKAKEESEKQLAEGELGLREMYHYLRVMRMAAGQRLLKLRAEVRMWEALRHARIWTILISAVLIFLSWYISTQLAKGENKEVLELANLSWAILKTLFILFLFILSPLKKDNIKKLWKKYWDDIVLHYRLIKKLK